MEEFEEKIEALGQQEEEENKSETWISNLVKEYAKVNSENTRSGLEGLNIGIVYQGGITCGAIDEPTKSSKTINERVITNFRNKNVVIARFCDKNEALS